jgi:hypothetical protein
MLQVAEGIREVVAEYSRRTGNPPAVCRVSRGCDRHLVEAKAARGAIGNLIVGAASVDFIACGCVVMRTVIDEMLDGDRVVAADAP